MKIKQPEVRNVDVIQKYATLCCPGIIKRIFVKAVKEKGLLTVLSVGDGMRKNYVRRCRYEIARCA